MRRKVICIQPLHPEGMKLLHSRPDLEIIVPETPDPATWANFLPGAEAICVRLTKIPRDMMERRRTSRSSRATASASTTSTWPRRPSAA